MTPASLRVIAVGALGSEAPSFRVRTRIPAPELARHGVDLRHVPLFNADEDRRFHASATSERVRILLRARRRLRSALDGADGDVALVQRQVDLLPGLGLERQVASGRRLVLDIDDAIWLDRSEGAGGHRLAFLKGTPRKVRWLAERADVVLAGNELLAEWLATHARRVEVVPSLVEHRDVPVRSHGPGEGIVLGWIGSSSTAAHLARLAEPLRRLARNTDTKMELLVVGGTAADDFGMPVRCEGWSEQREREFLRMVDIGLMPLNDTPWARGKCSYKALQYMAAGIPVVADDVGISAQVIGHDHGGLIAHSSHEWSEHLAALARDSGLRARLGVAGRARVAADFSVERWGPRLAEILRSVQA